MRLLILLLLCATVTAQGSNEDDYTPPEQEYLHHEEESEPEFSEPEVSPPDPEEVSEHEVDAEEESEPEVIPEEESASEVVKPETNVQFAAPKGMCNVTIEFGDKELLVSKAYLAIHSPVLADSFSEGPEHQSFVFEEQYEYVVKSVEKFLIASLKYPPLEVDKLLLADQYSITKLRDYYLGFFGTAKDLAVIKSEPEYESLSDGTKAAVLNRMMTLYPANWC